MNEYGKKIKELRTKRGMSRSELAKRINVTYSAVYAYETGARAVGIDTLIAISEVLGYELNDFVDYEEPTEEFEAKLIGWAEDIAESKPDAIEQAYQEYLSAFMRLNQDGKLEAVKRMKELARLEEYTK